MILGTGRLSAAALSPTGFLISGTDRPSTSE